MLEMLRRQDLAPAIVSDWIAFAAGDFPLALAVAPDVRGLVLPAAAARARRRGPVVRRAARARSAGGAAPSEIPTRFCANSLRSLPARRSCTRNTASAAIAACASCRSAGNPAEFLVTRIRRRRPAVRPGAYPRPRHALHRRRAGIRALAPARHRAMGQGASPRRGPGSRRRGRTARSLFPPRGACRAVPLQFDETALPRVRSGLSIRGDDRPARCDRGGARRHALGPADGSGGLRRRRFRQDRGGAPRLFRRRVGRPPGGSARADDAARPAACADFRRPLRGLAGPGREPVAIPQSGRAAGGDRGPRGRHGRHRDRHAPAVAARRRTSTISVSSSSTRNTASASATRNGSSNCARTSTC